MRGVARKVAAEVLNDSWKRGHGWRRAEPPMIANGKLTAHNFDTVLEVDLIEHLALPGWQEAKDSLQLNDLLDKTP